MSRALARVLGRVLSRVLGTALLAALVTMPATMPARGEMPLTLEAIVKFSSATPLGRRLERAVGRMLDEGSTDLGRLAEPLDALAQAIAIPLEPRGITSGREVVVGIREDVWLGAVERACREHEAVAHAALVDLGADSSLLATHRVEARLAASTPERRLVASAYPDTPASDRVQALAERLAAPSEVPVRGVAVAEDRLGLTVDRAGALGLLVERLRASESVQYAQANTLLRTQ